MSRAILLAIGLAVAVSAVAPRAGAQCGAATSQCHACHEANGRSPERSDGEPWHRDHAFGDFCAACHGGNPDAKDVAAAHVGLSSPLDRVAEVCGGCHGASTGAVALRYEHARVEPSPPRPVVRAASVGHASRANATLAAVVALIALMGGGWIARRERSARGPSRWRTRAFLARESWSPYLAGAGLGVTATVSVAVFGKRLTGAGAYQQIAGALGRLAAPDHMYFRHVLASGWTWELLLLVGTLLGALAAALSSGSFRWRTMPDSQWADVFGPSVARRWLVVFVGTAILELAGGIAGGCTASLAISGGGVLAPAAFLFMIGMFAGGIAVARILYSRRR